MIYALAVSLSKIIKIFLIFLTTTSVPFFKYVALGKREGGGGRKREKQGEGERGSERERGRERYKERE